MKHDWYNSGIGRTILQGEVPSPVDPPSGCYFHPRCPIARDGICGVESPELLPAETDENHLAAYHLRTGGHQDLDPRNFARSIDD